MIDKEYLNEFLQNFVDTSVKPVDGQCHTYRAELQRLLEEKLSQEPAWLSDDYAALRNLEVRPKFGYSLLHISGQEWVRYHDVLIVITQPQAWVLDSYLPRKSLETIPIGRYLVEAYKNLSDINLHFDRNAIKHLQLLTL